MSNAYPIKAVAWGIDDTLIDSEWLHNQAVTYALKHLGIALNPEISMLGLSWDMLWKKIGHPANDFKKFSGLCTDYYIQGLRNLSPRENVLEIVMKISALGLPQIGVSNRQHRIVEANIAWLDLQNLFAGTVAREDVKLGKPDPEMYLLAASKLGVEPDKILAIEDSPLGARAAYQAGLQTIFWPKNQSMEIEGLNTFYHKRIQKIDEMLEFTGVKRSSRLTPEMLQALKAYGNLR